MGGLLAVLYGVTTDDIYLSPAPLYHAAPLRFSLGMQALGCTVVVMEHFDAEQERCRKCGCWVSIKTYLKAEKCPIGKW